MDDLTNKSEFCLKTKSYCGYIDQNEFIQRYFFIRKRIDNSLTRNELAFLLGRTPFFMIDYEELTATTKFDLTDIDLLSLILKNGKSEILQFDKKNGQADISREKRLVRVIQREYERRIEYNFVHPWTTYGENEPLFAKEPIYTSCPKEEQIKLIEAEVLKFLLEGFFDRQRSACEIHERIWHTYKYKSNAWSVLHLKDVIYQYISMGKLVARYSNNHFMYHLKQ